MHDAHFHYSEEIVKKQKAFRIPSICNVSNPSEYEKIKENNLVYSAGIHPWYCDKTSWDEMLPIMKEAPFIGEIGMDNVWCETDHNLQKEVFVKQIQFAEERNKPVILHTKGQEKEILEVLKQYPNTYVIHWYSCSDYVEEYNEVASYFTVGPSVGKDETVTELVRKIDVSKLLLETDGIDAIEWAIGNRAYVSTLQHSLNVIAEIKGISPQVAEQIMDSNFERLMKEGR